MLSATFTREDCRKRCHAKTRIQTNAKFVEVLKATLDYWIFMNSSLVSFNGLHSGSFRAKLGMELNSRSHVKNGEEAKRSNDVGKDFEINSSNLIMKPASSETKNERTFSFGSTENLTLPTVFEGKITNERKVSQHEKLSTIGKFLFIINL